MSLGDEGAVKKALGFGLIGGYGGRTGVETVQQSVTVRIEESFYFSFLGEEDEAGVEVGRHPGRQAAAEHEPFGALEIFSNRLFDAGEFSGLDVWAALIEFYGQTLFVDDGEVGADAVADADEVGGEAGIGEQFLEAFPGLAAGAGDGFGGAVESVDNDGGVDAATAGGFIGREDISTVLEDKAVGLDVTVNSGVKGERKNQAHIIAIG